MCRPRQREQWELLCRIAAAGCPIDVDLRTPATSEDLIISQEAEANLFDMGRRGACLSLYILVASARGRITIAEFGDVIAPWAPLRVTWLSPLPDSSRAYPYVLPNRFEFPRDTVLNDKLGETGKTLQRGQHIEGFALGYTPIPIPEIYVHGSPVDAEFSVFDVLGEEYRSPVKFLVDRLCGGVQQRSARTGQGLYGPTERPRPSDVDQLGTSQPGSGESDPDAQPPGRGVPGRYI